MFSIELIRPPFRHGVPIDDAKTIAEATRKLDAPWISIQKDDLLIARDIEDRSVPFFAIALSQHKTELVGKEFISIAQVAGLYGPIKNYGEAWNTAYYESTLDEFIDLTNTASSVQITIPVINAYLRIFSLQSGVKFSYESMRLNHLREINNLRRYILATVREHHLNPDIEETLYRYAIHMSNRDEILRQMNDQLCKLNHKTRKENIPIVAEFIKRAFPFRTFMKSVDPQLAQIEF